MKRIENALARCWHILGIAAVVLFALGCSGLTVQDVVDSAGDAVAEVDPAQVVEDVSSGNWLGVVVTTLSVIGVVLGGIVARKKLKERSNAQ